MVTRRSVLAAAAVLALASPLAAPASSATQAGFTEAAFNAAKAAGKPILVEVSAPWCPTCKAQKPILAELAGRPKFRDLQVFEVDFDSQKDVLRALGVRQQSTLIVFKGGKEVGRSTGDTRKESIEALVTMAVN